MTRDEIYTQCVEKITKTNSLLLEAATGVGKTAIALKLCNYLINSQWYKDRKEINILILVAKIVHKQTWKDEINKWGGINHPTAKINICMECYESLRKHTGERWDIILADEVHHINSEARLEVFKTLSFGYFIGLSATIPKLLSQTFRFTYHAAVVSCSLSKAIEEDILPDPQVILFPLILDNRSPSETWEINKTAKGSVVYGEIKDIWKYKKEKKHAILSCTQKQKLLQYDRLIDWEKQQYMLHRRKNLEQTWLYHSGKRLEYLALCKNPIVYDILKKLSDKRTVTFCKSIEQAEVLGKWHIHSLNKQSDEVYNLFNQKKIDHITTVNILNENANLVDCQYGIFANISSSEVVVPQRIGRLLRHRNPVIIIPYYAGTREEEIIKEKMLVNFNKDNIKTIHSINEI